MYEATKIRVLNDFKMINDTMRHDIGEQLLIKDNIIAVKITGEGEKITDIRWNLYR